MGLVQKLISLHSVTHIVGKIRTSSMVSYLYKVEKTFELKIPIHYVKKKGFKRQNEGGNFLQHQRTVTNIFLYTSHPL